MKSIISCVDDVVIIVAIDNIDDDYFNTSYIYVSTPYMKKPYFKKNDMVDTSVSIYDLYNSVLNTVM